MRKNRKWLWMFFMLLFLVVSGVMTGRTVSCMAAETTKNPVEPYSLDYDTEWLMVKTNGNSKVYYSDEKMTEWYEAEMISSTYCIIDTSWTKASKNAVINLKGDANDTIVPVEIPAQNTKLKIKLDKVSMTLSFENLTAGVTTFQWRKSTSYEWKTVTITDAQNANSAFVNELKKMQIKGAKICIRLPQTKGAVTNGVFSVGVRPSKEIKVTIPKLKNAPKVTIDGTKLTLATKATMEYSLDNGTTWVAAENKMNIEAIAPSTLIKKTSSPKAVTILFRYAATSSSAASKMASVTIPAQRSAPSVGTSNTSEVKWAKDSQKFYLTFTKAEKKLPYEYTVVKPDAELDLTKASWKSVTSTKEIALTSKTAPEGSTIYVRKKTIKATSTTEFEMASEMASIKVTYK